MLLVFRALLVAVALTVTASALAGNEAAKIDEAREMGDKGVALYQDGKHAAALELFVRAEELHHAPTLVLYIARCHDKLGQLMEAVAFYREILAEELPVNAPDQFEKARAAAHSEVDLLIPRIPTVSLMVSAPPGTIARVTIDGREIPRVRWLRVELDPGDHTFEATAAGMRTATRNELVPEGARMELTLELAPIPAQAPPERVPAAEPLPLYPAWIGLAAGGAGLVVGAITGGLHLSEVSALKSRCRPDDRCPAADRDVADEAQTLATVSTVTFIVGGVLSAAAAGYAIAVVTTNDDAVALRVAPTGATLRVRF